MARKHAEALVLQFVTDITGGDKLNAELYKKFFKTLSDKRFKEWIQAVSDPTDLKTVLHLTVPVWGKTQLSVKQILKVAEKYNTPVFNEIVITNPDGTQEVVPKKVLVCKLPIRRASQVIEVQMKAPKHDTSIDKLTGQAAGDSSSGRVSLPEMDILGMYGWDDAMYELGTVRGGDLGAYEEYKRQLLLTGNVTRSAVEPAATRPESIKTLKNLQLAQYIVSSL